MSGRRVVAALLAMVMGVAVLTALAGAPPASADKAPAGSEMTQSGTGDFANLKVTVSQTKTLINQTVTVTWTGGEPTVPKTEFGLHYLQIMQCWGDGQNGPDRTQCQYGGSVSQTAPSAGSWVRSRQVSYGQIVDPKETLKKKADSFDQAYVPFWPVGNPQPAPVATSDHSDFYDAQVTNENPTARTHGDGTGVEFFEIQTVTQAAGLGCGEPINTGGTVSGRKCWLVVVPRGNKEVNGSTVGDNQFLNSSPLSESNWENRIVFPLEFLPVGLNCPIGAAERRVIGHELAADAVSRWQPVLCAGRGALYNYTQLGDDVVRNQVLDGSSPGLALMTNPISPDQAPPNRPLIYAPVGLSGLAIAFNVEHQAAPGAPPEQVQLDGQRFLSMKLTPRLVAKLLTQSYQGAVAGPQDYLKNNPTGLTVDPEFLKINPEYTAFANFNTPPDALVQLTNSDLTSLLWSWVTADPDARDFLAGKPDPSGMVVNPNNKDLALPTSTFPRNDQSCQDVVVIAPNIKGRLCTLDSHPFTNDMHDSGLSASRGDTQARTVAPDTSGSTVAVKKVDRQSPGRRAVLALVDAATASRYGLATAQLQNAAKAFVAPTTESLQAGEAAMKPSAVGGVLTPDPATANPAAYPLTALSYAVAAPSALDAAAGKDYATLLRYAAGPGQLPGVEPGQLPLGMAPLPDVLRAQTVAAAATIEAQAGKVAGGLAAPQPTSVGGAVAPARIASGANEAASTGGTATPSGSSGTTPPGAVAQVPGGPGDKAPSVAEQPVAGVRRTPSLPVPAVGALLLVILISGGLAVTSSPVLHLLSGGGLHRLRKEMVPPEQ